MELKSSMKPFLTLKIAIHTLHILFKSSDHTKWNFHPLIYQKLLSSFLVSGTVPGTWDILMKKKQVPAFKQLHSNENNCGIYDYSIKEKYTRKVE